MAKRDDVEKKDFSYFGIQSSWGVTKHLGGRRATERLVELCAITADSKVLEIGCGVGITACYLAKEVGCSLTSVDLSEQMIAWAKKRATREGVADRITFQVGDAQNLPFSDETFDAVISESVTAFAPDKPKAVNEYLRVLKPGGRVGLTEASWVKTPPPAELVEFLSHSMEGAEFLEPEGWRALLDRGGFTDLGSEVSHLTARSQLASDLNGQSWRDVADRFRAMGAFIRQYLTDADLRRYAKTLMPSRRTMRSFFTYFGYGIYTGRKAQ
ncbi:MAG: class I SAM-dependent methyltransferase [Micropruina sp.]